MIMNLAPIDVLPTLIQDTAVGKRPRGVFVFAVAGELLDVAAIPVATVEDRDLGEPAIHPSFATRRAKDNTVIREVGRLDVIPGAFCNLDQIVSIQIRFIEVEIRLSTLPVGEKDSVTVVVELRITEVAPWIFKERGKFFGFEVEFVEAASLFISEAIRVGGVMPEIGVPMTVLAGLTDGEDDFIDV